MQKWAWPKKRPKLVIGAKHMSILWYSEDPMVAFWKDHIIGWPFPHHPQKRSCLICFDPPNRQMEWWNTRFDGVFAQLRLKLESLFFLAECWRCGVQKTFKLRKASEVVEWIGMDWLCTWAAGVLYINCFGFHVPGKGLVGGQCFLMFNTFFNLFWAFRIGFKRKHPQFCTLLPLGNAYHPWYPILWTCGWQNIDEEVNF